MNRPELEQLKDIILPEPIGWWPLASSVWITLLIITVLIIGLVWYFWQRHQQAVYRRYAQQKLVQSHELDDATFLYQVNALLKQVAITTYGRQTCAGLNQQAWLSFLHQKASFIEQPDAIKKLESYYQAEFELSRDERQAIAEYARRWIKEHHL